MRRPSFFGVFLLILAADTCPENDCAVSKDCDNHNLSSARFDLPVGDYYELSATDCNTCAHSTVKVNWGFATGVTGNVKVTAQGFCKSGLSGQASPQEFAGAQGNATFEPPNIKNLCGDAAPMSWVVDIQNLTNQKLTSALITITCPHNPTATSPTAPSATIRGR